MKIIAKCTNIEWDFDDIEGKPPKLPKTVRVKLDAEEYLSEDGSGTAECIADILSDEFGFCVKGLNVSYEPDPDETLKWARKFLRNELKLFQKAQKAGDLAGDRLLEFFRKANRRGIEYSFDRDAGKATRIRLMP